MACNKADEPETLTLSLSEATVEVGKTVVITATASSPITVQINNEIATASVDGYVVTVTGVAEGTAELWITAGHRHATCTITVVKHTPGDDDPTPSPIPIDDSSDISIVGTRYVAGAVGIVNSRTVMNYTVTHLFAERTAQRGRAPLQRHRAARHRHGGGHRRASDARQRRDRRAAPHLHPPPRLKLSTD